MADSEGMNNWTLGLLFVSSVSLLFMFIAGVYLCVKANDAGTSDPLYKDTYNTGLALAITPWILLFICILIYVRTHGGSTLNPTSPSASPSDKYYYF